MLIGIAAAGALSLLTGVQGASAESKGTDAVSEKLQVESRNGKVLVHLTFANHGDQVVYLPRSVASDSEAAGAWFEVRDSSNGDPLDYIGPMVKRAPPGKHDYVALKPHAVHRHTIDISKTYAFLQGRHTYELSYSGSYLTDIARPEAAAEVQPEPVMFAFVAP
ncbi:MAG: hypothetical protein ABIT83_00505 [Massilia sp.]